MAPQFHKQCNHESYVAHILSTLDNGDGDLKERIMEMKTLAHLTSVHVLSCW